MDRKEIALKIFWAIEERSIDHLTEIINVITRNDINISLYFACNFASGIFTQDEMKRIKVYLLGKRC